MRVHPVLTAKLKEQAIMKKLRNVLAGVLLSLPIMALNASALTKEDAPVGLNPTHSVTGWCWVYFMGRYIAIPC
jgi:hypothetical protein